MSCIYVDEYATINSDSYKAGNIVATYALWTRSKHRPRGNLKMLCVESLISSNTTDNNFVYVYLTSSTFITFFIIFFKWRNMFILGNLHCSGVIYYISRQLCINESTYEIYNAKLTACPLISCLTMTGYTGFLLVSAPTVSSYYLLVSGVLSHTILDCKKCINNVATDEIDLFMCLLFLPVCLS